MAELTQNGDHQKMGTHLAKTIEAGKGSVPADPAPLVCKP